VSLWRRCRDCGERFLAPGLAFWHSRFVLLLAKGIRITFIAAACTLSLLCIVVLGFRFLEVGKYFPAREIPWAEARVILEQSSLKSVGSAHSGKVWITTKWGFRYTTHEPRDSGMFQLLQRRRKEGHDFFWGME